MKKILLTIAILLAAFFIIPLVTNAALTPVSWIRDTVAGFVRPGILTDTLRIPSLTSCDTIDTDADGDLTCGTDGGLSDGDKGDITVSGSGATWTIDNDVVTFAKMQNITTNRLLGRSTASTGDVEQISIGSGLSLSAGVLSNTFAGAVGGAGEIQFTDGVGTFVSDPALTFNNGTGELATNLFTANDITVLNGITFLTNGTLLSETAASELAIDSKKILTENNTVTVTNKTIDSDTNTLSVDPDELKSVDSPADEECYTYESTGTTGEWQTCGGIPTQITVADTSGDTTSFFAIFDSDTGNLQPKTDANLKWNATSNVLEIDGPAQIGGNIRPISNDGGALGTSSFNWSDLFLALGSVINWNAGDLTLTHSADTLTLAGGTLVLPASGLQIGSSNPFSDSAGTLTLQNIDAIDGTTETTLESAIDIAGDVTGTGLGAVTVVSASDTTAGKVELATTAETNTGTDTARAVTPDGLAGSYAGTKNVSVYAVAVGTALTTGDGKAYFVIPAELNGMNLVDVQATITTTSSSGDPQFDIARGRQANATTAHAYVDVLSTNITIDATEYDSKDDATQRVIDASNDDVATGDIYRFDTDGIGTGSAGLMYRLSFRLP